MDITQIVQQLTGNSALVTAIVSMLPIIELRGAIPIGVGLGLTHFEAMAISIVANCIPVPFIVLFVRRLFQWMKAKIRPLRGFVEKLEKKAESKRATVEKWKIWGLVIFVAIPLPGTGAWTGAMIAGLLDIRLRRAIPAIAIGVLIAGILVTGITYGFTSILA